MNEDQTDAGGIKKPGTVPEPSLAPGTGLLAAESYQSEPTSVFHCVVDPTPPTTSGTHFFRAPSTRVKLRQDFFEHTGERIPTTYLGSKVFPLQDGFITTVSRHKVTIFRLEFPRCCHLRIRVFLPRTHAGTTWQFPSSNIRIEACRRMHAGVAVMSTVLSTLCFALA